jgi:hypothetical protein
MLQIFQFLETVYQKVMYTHTPIQRTPHPPQYIATPARCPWKSVGKNSLLYSISI